MHAADANERTDVSISLLAESETVHVMSKHHWKNMFNQFSCSKK
jgi:hypothetical protein